MMRRSLSGMSMAAALLIWACGGGSSGPVVDAGPDIGGTDSVVSDGPGNDGPGNDGPIFDGPGNDGPPVDLGPDTVPPADGPIDTGWFDAGFSGPQWSAMAVPAGNGTLWGVWGSGPTDVFAVGSGGLILHHDGRKSAGHAWWHTMASGTSQVLYGVWGNSARDVFAAGARGASVGFNGSRWSSLTSVTSQNLRAIWGSGYTDVYASGEFGRLYQVARNTLPNSWKALQPNTKGTLLAGWSAGAKNVWVVGSGGKVVNYNGQIWAPQKSGTTDALWSIWGSGASNIYAVGARGTILRYTGGAWTRVSQTLTKKSLHGVWGSSSSDIWVVGESGTILHFDGSRWSLMASGTTEHLRAVWGAGAGNVFAVGDWRTILQFGRCDCRLGNRCYRAGERDATGCHGCVPSSSRTSLSAVTGDCTIGGVCATRNELDSSGCKTCDPVSSTSAWSPVADHCNIGGRCHPRGAPGPTTCYRCDPSKSSSAWTVAPNTCIVNNRCWAAGEMDSGRCQVCDPSRSTTALSPLAGRCKIGGTCYPDKTRHPTIACYVCDLSASASAWSITGGYCYIGGKCLTHGTRDASGCFICDSTKTPTAWSNAGCPVQNVKKTVAFAHGTAITGMTLATINSDGTSYARVSGFGPLYLPGCSVSGRVRQHQRYTADVPGHLEGVSYSPALLPGGKGWIKWYADSAAKRVGVMLVRPGGAVERLYSTPGSSFINHLSSSFAVSDDGKFVATHRPGRGLVLMRTDNKLYPGGVASLELLPASAPGYIYPASVTVTNRAVFMISRNGSAGARHTLWWAPTDGSRKIAAVVLPTVGGKVPQWIDDEIAFSREGNLAVVTAGVYHQDHFSNHEDVIAVNANTGVAKNLSNLPSDYGARGSTWGYHSGGSQLAVSAKGTHVAFVGSSSVREQLFVARADGASAPVRVSSSANFGAGNLHTRSLRWADDKVLVFHAHGSSSSYGDLFTYRPATGTLTNASRINAGSRPYTFPASGTLNQPRGMWFSPNRRYWYAIVRSTTAGKTYQDLRAVNLAAGTLRKLTDGFFVSTGSEGFGACGNSARMFFAATPGGVGSSRAQLYSFDMNSASSPVKLTSFLPVSGPAQWWIYSVTPSPGCSRVAFRCSHPHATAYDVYTVKLGSSPTTYGLTSRYTTDSDLQWSQDSQWLAFAGASGSFNMYLHSSPADRVSCCKIQKLYPSGSGLLYWQLLGVK